MEEKKNESFRKADELEKMNSEEAAIFTQQIQTARGTGKRYIIREVPKKDT